MYDMFIFLFQEEELYEIDIPLSFVATVGARVHGLACWFDVLFNGRSVYFT
jgi:type I protein arginine methyltransferase